MTAMVTVRRATQADDARVADLIARYARDFAFELGDQDVAEEGRQARAHYAAGGLLVATVDGEVVGCVAFEPWGEGRARMKRMYVDPDARGAGAGRALATAVMDAARAAGHRVMLLDTTRGMAAARALYASLGFEEWQPDYTAPCRDTVYMRREL